MMYPDGLFGAEVCNPEPGGQIEGYSVNCDFNVTFGYSILALDILLVLIIYSTVFIKINRKTSLKYFSRMKIVTLYAKFMFTPVTDLLDSILG